MEISGTSTQSPSGLGKNNPVNKENVSKANGFPQQNEQTPRPPFIRESKINISTTPSNRTTLSNEVVSGTSKGSFKERNPGWAKFFSVLATVFAAPLIIAGNLILTPFLMGAMFFSQTCGDRGLRSDVEGSPVTKLLWGHVAETFEKKELGAIAMAFIGLFPVYGPMICALGGIRHLYERVLKSMDTERSAN